MHKGVVKKITNVSPDVKQYTIQIVDGSFSGNSGQYTVVQKPNSERTPYSTMLASKERVVLMMRNYQLDEYMANVEVGDRISVESKLKGNLYLRSSDRPIALLSTGSGIAPLMGIMYEYIEKNGEDAIFVFGEKNVEQQLYKSIIEQFGLIHNINHRYVLSREEWYGREGHIQEYIGDISTEKERNRDIYISGVPDMVLETKSFLSESGIDTERIYIESYLK
jgi:NAD(P)H-flavin reductase